MSNFKRYKLVRDDQDGACFCQVKECEYGAWVKFDDIKEFLNPASNSRSDEIAWLNSLKESCNKRFASCDDLGIVEELANELIAQLRAMR